MKVKQKSKLVQVWLPMQLYERFRASKYRRDSNTDGEALRVILSNVLNVESESQQNNVQSTAKIA